MPDPVEQAKVNGGKKPADKPEIEAAPKQQMLKPADKPDAEAKAHGLVPDARGRKWRVMQDAERVSVRGVTHKFVEGRVIDEAGYGGASAISEMRRGGLKLREVEPGDVEDV
jgi:hypothetical protein